ncbi:hypothetical protein VMCG_07771 [Cytospora schulzeri]|uniref:Peptidase C1A papain C-terminal domain-containing protein n=1 Tax=Cytospora schulzeri TaxID=448051 RepID=A0A423VZN1_9PEZI|nr:hypothetical protein VMCG_07771 [Valsa malicola]
MLFGVLADAAEADANLGAEAIDVAHRTHNGVLDAIGVNRIVPNPVKNVTDSAYDTSQSLVLNAGQKTAAFLRTIDGPSEDRQDNEENSTDEEVYDQGHMMSCTAHAVAGAFEFTVKKLNLPKFEPSKLFIWYHAREQLHDPQAVKKNIGTNLRDAIKSLGKAHGVCSEYDWSYEVGQYNEKTDLFLAGAKAAKKPPALAERNAHHHIVTKYHRITGREKTTGKYSKPQLRLQLLKCLDEGHPFVFLMKTYNLLHNVQKDELPTAKDEKNGEHRHSLLAVGYSQSKRMFLVRNSWGSGFGWDGYFYMPYDYLTHCQDFWTVCLVESYPDKA